MFRLSVVSFAFALTFSTVQAHAQNSDLRPVAAIQQAEIAKQKKQLSETNTNIESLKNTIRMQAEEIRNLNTQISNLQSRIESTNLTFTRIHSTPTTGAAACEALGKQCVSSYGGDKVEYSCDFRGVWMRVICAAPF